MISFVLSTIAFFVAAFFLNRYLDEQGIGKGMTRGILVLVLASVASSGVSFLMNSLSHKPGGSGNQTTAGAAMGEAAKRLGHDLSGAP